MEDCPSAFLSLSFIVRNGSKFEKSNDLTTAALAWLEAQEAVYEHNYPKAIEILNRVADNNLR